MPAAGATVAGMETGLILDAAGLQAPVMWATARRNLEAAAARPGAWLGTGRNSSLPPATAQATSQTSPALTHIALSSVLLSERRADATGDTHGTVRACTLCQG
jgi:hypothetical protein